MTPDPAVFLRMWLSAQPDIVARIGSGHAMRFAPWLESQDQPTPRISYTLVSGANEQILEGPAGLWRPRVQLDVWSNDRDEAWAIAVLIRGNPGDRRLDGFRGPLAGMIVKSCRCVDVADNFVAPFEGDERGIGSVRLDFTLGLADY
jgi:hypothetical protein